jgi:hypothetical protein
MVISMSAPSARAESTTLVSVAMSPCAVSNLDFEITTLDELRAQAGKNALLALFHVKHVIELHELDLPILANSQVGRFALIPVGNQQNRG